MRKKIIGMFVCMLLLVTATLPAMGIKTIDNSTVNNLIIDSERTVSSHDVPIWKKGTVWTYKIDDVNLDYVDNESGAVFHLHFGTGNFPVKVVSTSGSSYLVSFNVKISGDMYIDADDGYTAIKVQGKLVKANLKGNIYFRKTDLAIESITTQLSTKVSVTISKPIQLPALRMLINLKLNYGFSSPYTLLSFPIETGMSWGLPATGLSIDGSIKSPWLRVVNVAHTTMRLAGLIPADYKDLSDKIAQILPVIHIDQTMNLFGVSNPLSIPEVPDLFYCSDMENITVLAGSYDAYPISIWSGFSTMYYAPDVGNIIKMTGNLINMELVKVKTTEYPIYN
jgi:hypothetical protein